MFNKTCANKIHELDLCKLKAAKYYGLKNAFVCPEHGLVQDMDFDAFVAHHPADKCLVGFSTFKKVEVAQRIYVEKPIEAVVPQVPQIPDVSQSIAPQVILPVVPQAPLVISNDAIASILKTMLDYMMVQQETNSKSLKRKNMVEEYKVVKGSEGIIYAISSDDEAIVKEEKNPDDNQNDLILDLSLPNRKRLTKTKIRLRSPSFDFSYYTPKIKSGVDSGIDLSIRRSKESRESRESKIKSSIEPDIESEIENNAALNSEIHDIGFENLCPEKQYIPSRDILNVANMDKTYSKVEQQYRRANKKPTWKTGLSIKNRSSL